MSNPTAPPGWYPDPQAAQTLRFWDGAAWTSSRAPAAPTVTVVAAPPAGPNHLLHLILTLVSCGIWAPVWLLVAIAANRPSGAPMSRWGSVASVAAVVLLVAAGLALNFSRYR